MQASGARLFTRFDLGIILSSQFLADLACRVSIGPSSQLTARRSANPDGAPSVTLKGPRGVPAVWS